jgi:pimeloyl-ACP methyl ester carboxylesterase
MGGQVCLAVALRAQELDVSGVIACEACDYVPAHGAQKIYSLPGDESILNPERVCGMMAPTSPDIYKRLIWWLYSAQASRMFPGDLKFYLEGWDGRDRMSQIDTKSCPVYMLTGEYDYSCSPDMSRETAAKIKGAMFEEMKGLGHFPFSEDPERFLPYFKEALGFIGTANTESRS